MRNDISESQWGCGVTGHVVKVVGKPESIIRVNFKLAVDKLENRITVKVK